MQITYWDHYTEVLHQLITSQLCKTYNNCEAVMYNFIYIYTNCVVVIYIYIYIYIYIHTYNNFSFILWQFLNSFYAGCCFQGSYLLGRVVWYGMWYGIFPLSHGRLWSSATLAVNTNSLKVFYLSPLKSKWDFIKMT